MTHHLKILPKYLKAIIADRKTFEIRDERDRKFKPQDRLILREWCPYSMDYTGRELKVRVTHIQRINIGKVANFAVMSIHKEPA